MTYYHAAAILAVAALLLTGCARQLSNKEIVDAVKYCEANGLRPTLERNFDGTIFRVVCVPMESGSAK